MTAALGLVSKPLEEAFVPLTEWTKPRRGAAATVRCTTRAEFTIPLPVKLPAPNLRLHHMAKARLVAELRQMVAAGARSQRHLLKAPAAGGPRTLDLTLIRGKGQRFFDPDSAVASLKGAIDGLVDARWLRGDDAKSLTALTVRQERGITPALRATVSGWDGIE